MSLNTYTEIDIIYIIKIGDYYKVYSAEDDITIENLVNFLTVEDIGFTINIETVRYCPNSFDFILGA